MFNPQVTFPSLLFFSLVPNSGVSALKAGEWKRKRRRRIERGRREGCHRERKRESSISYKKGREKKNGEPSDKWRFKTDYKRRYYFCDIKTGPVLITDGLRQFCRGPIECKIRRVALKGRKMSAPQ